MSRLRTLTVLVTAVTGIGSLAFSLGTYTARLGASRQLAESEARVEAVRLEMLRTLTQVRGRRLPLPAPTGGTTVSDGELEATAGGRHALVDQIKADLQREMGLLAPSVLRERRQSFVELHSSDSLGASNYGTAGYLGSGYFVTVKHGVAPLAAPEGRESRRVVSIRIIYRGRSLAASLIDFGDAEVEVDRGDWAIIRVAEPVDLPGLRIDLNYPFEFADPIYRFGNDYSKGIIVATGYVGQITTGGLVTCLTDGHPGVSGGGVVDRRGHLVGIPIGRMQGDYRFSFILPLRREMFRKVPKITEALDGAVD